MIPDGTYTAVLDRIEDALATLEIEDGDALHSLVVDETRLPATARHQDAVLTVVIEDGDLLEASYDPEETTERGERAQDRFDRLSERPPQDDEE